MATITPEEIQERIQQAASRRPRVEKINNEALLAETGLRVVHVETFQGRITVAYRPPTSKVLEISTSLCRKGDNFSRKFGTRQAVQHFLAGKTIFIPRGNAQPVWVIQDLFPIE